MRVIRLIARLNVGGPARQVVVLDQQLRRLGCETLLVYGEPGPSEGSLDALAEARQVSAIALPTLGRRISALRDLLTAWRVLRLLFTVRPDVVHTHTAKAGALGRAAAVLYNATRRRSRRAAVVHTFHGHVFAGYFGPAGSRAVRAAERALARTTDRIITLSPQQRDDVTRRFAVAPAAKVDVVGAGHDLDALLALPLEAADTRGWLGWNDRHVVIGFVGRLVAIKDLPTLVGAFARVAAEVPEARLLVAGDGEERAAIMRLVAQLGLDDRVRFLGWFTDLPRLYAAIDIVALTSRNEGVPASLIEGMAAGRAVAASAVGGVPDLVSDGRTGVLFEPGSIDRAAAAMLDLVRQPGRRRTLGRAAREVVSGRFTPVRLAQDTLNVYRAALLSRRGLPSQTHGTAGPKL